MRYDVSVAPVIVKVGRKKVTTEQHCVTESILDGEFYFCKPQDYADKKEIHSDVRFYQFIHEITKLN